MQPEKGASKYEIYQDTANWLDSLPLDWPKADLTESQRLEIECWFSSQEVTTMSELVDRLQELADATWDFAPPRDVTDSVGDEPVQQYDQGPNVTTSWRRFGNIGGSL